MRSRHFDGVISDIRMIRKDGNALCREVRSDETVGRTVMIASSASVYDGDRRDAESAGFDDSLPKPIKERGASVSALPAVVLCWLESADRQKPLVVHSSAKGDLQIDSLASSDLEV